MIFGEFWVGTGEPIATKSQHLWAVPRQIEFWSILKKSWDCGIESDPPPPSLGQIPNFYRKFVLKASLKAQHTRFFYWLKSRLENKAQSQSSELFLCLDYIKGKTLTA